MYTHIRGQVICDARAASTRDGSAHFVGYLCLFTTCSQILLESRASHVAESAQLAAACMRWLADAGLYAFTPQLLLNAPELRQLATTQAGAINANQKAIDAQPTAVLPAAGMASAATGSISTAARVSTPEQCVQSAIDYLLQVGTILRSVIREAHELRRK
jgi:hypothetical protein